MEQWIFGFREGPERELTDVERAALSRRCRATRWGAMAVGCLVLVFAVTAIAALAVAADHPTIGWPLFIAGAGVGLWIYGQVGERDRLALIYRRAARLGRVRTWTRDVAPPHVRSHYTRAIPPDEDRDEGDPPETSEWVMYWEWEERFDRELERALGHAVQWFETVDGDTVVLTVEGKTTRRFIHAPVVSVKQASTRIP